MATRIKHDLQMRGFSQALEQGNPFALRALPEDISEVDGGQLGSTALMQAVESEDIAKLRLLLGAGARPERDLAQSLDNHNIIILLETRMQSY